MYIFAYKFQCGKHTWENFESQKLHISKSFLFFGSRFIVYVMSHLWPVPYTMLKAIDTWSGEGEESYLTSSEELLNYLS